MKLLLCSMMLFAATGTVSAGQILNGQVFAATYSDAAELDAAGCGAGTVGLIHPETGRWNASSCIKVDWADDAETASVIDGDMVLAYVTPGDGSDTFIAKVDFGAMTVATSIVGGDQGNLRCTPRGKCYGVLPGSSKTDPTALIEVDGRTGDSKTALTLKKYDGSSVDGAAVDPVNDMYHAVLVGKVHTVPNVSAVLHPRPGRTQRQRCAGARPCAGAGLREGEGADKSNQWLVTIDLSTMKVVSEQPVGMYFMGPFAYSKSRGLLTFGSDAYDGLAAVDWRTAKQSPVGVHGGSFGTVYQFSAAFSASEAYAVSLFPHPTRFFAVDVSGAATADADVRGNNTFASSVHALAAAWE